MPSVVTRLLSTLECLSLPVVTAESCTAGVLASALTSKPASPSLCLGGVTSYSPLFKNAVLGVPEDIIRGRGEVSEECARAMARGVLLERAQGIGVSTTGYLDTVPDGEQQEVFVGFHWLFAGREGTRVERLHVGHVRGRLPPGAGNVEPEDADRNERKETVVARALDVLLEIIEQLDQDGRAHSELRHDSPADVRRAECEIDDVKAAQT